MTAFLSAPEAARCLGVSRQTLYAYVSRGLLRAHETDDPRKRRYDAEAVARLAQDRRRGRRPKEIAKATLDWGMPVLESAIATIQDGRLYYRGRDAVVLARETTVEDAAALLWDLPVGDCFGPAAPVFPPAMAVALPLYAGVALEDSLLPLLAMATSDDSTAVWRRDRRHLAEGCGALVRVATAAIAGTPPAARPIHLWLGEAWGLDADGVDLLRMAIVLCADHELNASSFTARCVASTGASLRAAVLGGLAALSGARHGGMTARIESFWRGLDPGATRDALRRRLAAGEDPPGFGHPLYPDGDARARAILERVLPRFPEARALVAAAAELTGRQPNIDFALVCLRRFLRLPDGSAFGVFALGRSIGWIAHALEQRDTGQLIRPRAVYVGPPIDGVAIGASQGRGSR